MDVLTEKRIQNQFKLRGFSLMKDALEAIMSLISMYSFSDKEAVGIILEGLVNQDLKSSIIQKDVILDILSKKRLSLSEKRDIRVIDSFQIPKFVYDNSRKSFLRSSKPLSVLGSASSKTELLRDRLQILQQRLLRNKDFAKPALSLNDAQNDFKQLISIQSLLGSTGTKFILAAISQIEDGKFFLEDMSGTIPVDLTEALALTGLYTENCFVIVEGELTARGVFKVKFLGSPPIEPRQLFPDLFGFEDLTEGHILKREEMAALKSRESMAASDAFVVISDLWLDDSKCLARFSRVLEGYSSVETIPSMFLLLGNFSSATVGSSQSSQMSRMRAGFAELASILSSHPRITDSCTFVFVPGPNDPGPAQVLPRPALPSALTQDFSKLIPNSVFTSNPCRIKWYSQEIVVFREDLLHRMRRSCVVPSSDSDTNDPFEQMIVTLLQQSHLCPLPLSVQPLLWDYDHALRLYPVPNTVVLADSCAQRSFVYEGVTCFNPGSFAEDCTFSFYCPGLKDVEENSLEDLE